MTFSVEALSQGLGDDEWLAQINPPYKERTLHHQLLTSTKVPNPTAKKSFGFGVSATKQQMLPTKRFYLEDAAFGANAIKYIKEWNDPSLSSLERLQILQKQVVTAALIVAGDEANPYITIVTNPSITKIDDEDEDNNGAPFWPDILSEDLAYKIGVPYNRPSHLVAAGTGWSTRTDDVKSREDLIRKVQAVLLHPAERFGTQQEGVHHVLLLPALICPPVGFFWPTTTTYSEFVTSIKSLNVTMYWSFLTVLELCRSTIEPWFDKVNASSIDFRVRMQSAHPLINALPTTENPIPEGIEDESLLDPILELLYQVFWPYYEDRVLTDCNNHESSTHAASQLHHFLKYGRKCFPATIKSVYRSRIPFLIYFLRPSNGWMMNVDHTKLFSGKHNQAQWIQSYNSVGVPVVEDDCYEPVMIRTKLELAVEEDIDFDAKAKTTSHFDKENDIEETTPEPQAKVPPRRDDESELATAVLVRNISPQQNLADLSSCFVNRIKQLHREKVEVVSSRFVSNRKEGPTIFMEFEDRRHAKFALDLDGLLVGGRKISIHLVEAAESIAPIDMPKTSSTSKLSKWGHNDMYKTELCKRYENFCCYGKKCDFAHGVLDLRLHQTTQLHPDRCLYVGNIARNYPSLDLMNFIRKRFKKSAHAPPEFTALHVRGRLGDALVEFKHKREKTLARQLLHGVSLVGSTLKIHSWRAEYQRVFVAYFKDERDIPILVDNFDGDPNVATAHVSSATNSVAAQEPNRKIERLQKLLQASLEENDKLREAKRRQDEALGVLSESLYTMKLDLSTAMSEIDAMMQDIANLQEDKSSKTVPLSSLSHSSQGTDTDTETIQREIERLQKMISSSQTTNLEDSRGSSSSLPSVPLEIGQARVNQSYSGVF